MSNERITVSEEIPTFHQALDEAKKLFTSDDEVENVVIVVGMKNGQAHTITDMSADYLKTLNMMASAAREIGKLHARNRDMSSADSES